MAPAGRPDRGDGVGDPAGACVASIAAWRPVDVGEVSAVTEVDAVAAVAATWVVAASAGSTCAVGARAVGGSAIGVVGASSPAGPGATATSRCAARCRVAPVVGATNGAVPGARR